MPPGDNVRLTDKGQYPSPCLARYPELDSVGVGGLVGFVLRIAHVLAEVKRIWGSKPRE